MKRIVKMISARTKIKCLGVIVLAAVSALLGSLWPVKLGELYTSISGGAFATVAQGLGPILMFGAVYLLAEVMTSLRRVALERVVTAQEAEVREQSLGRLLKMPLSYYGDGLSGEKTAQLNQGIMGLSQLLKMGCNDVLATVLTAVCTLGQVLLNAPGIMVYIMLAYLVAAIVVSGFQIKSQNGIREKIVKKRNHYEGQVCQSITNIEMIRSMNAEDYETERLKPSISGISQTEKMHHTCMGLYDGIKQVCKIVFQVLLLITSIALIVRGEMAPGAVITVCLLFQQLIKPVDDVYRFMDEIASSIIKAKALLEINDEGIDSVYDIKSTDKTNKGDGISFENVVIRNPEGNKVIAEYENIYIPGGKRIALVGPNGCGKTTMVRGLIRYFKPESGTITLFGNNQDKYSQEELTSMVYYSPQRSMFVAGTVRDNLRYGIKNEVSDDDLIAALEKVHLFGNYEGVIAVEPYAALDTCISEGAKELSGGMKQRLALARAYLRRPKMFIFDEITANLDDAATDFVLTNLESYAESLGAGVIYISHDQKVVDRCDVVVEAVNGTYCDRKVKKTA